MALGLEVPIQLPPPPRRPWGLLVDVAEQIPAESFVSDGHDRLGLGLQHVPWGCEPLHRGSADCSAEFLLNGDGPAFDSEGEIIEANVTEDKFPAIGSLDEIVIHPAFKVVDGLRCGVLSLPERSDTGFTGITARILNRMRTLVSETLTAELVDGWASGGPSLMSEAVVLPTGFSMASTAAYIEQHLANTLHGASGTVFIPPALLHVAVDAKWVTREGSRYYTRTGHVVISDAGHNPAQGPGTSTDGFWIYASGPVHYRLSDTRLLGEGSETLDLHHNIRERLAEAWAQLAFDPCSVAAAHLDAEALEFDVLVGD